MLFRSPAQFVLDLNSTTYQIERTRDATLHLSQFYQRNEATLGEFLALGKSVEGDLPEKFRCNPQQTEPTIAALLGNLDLLERADTLFRTRCIDGLEADAERCASPKLSFGALTAMANSSGDEIILPSRKCS